MKNAFYKHLVIAVSACIALTACVGPAREAAAGTKPPSASSAASAAVFEGDWSFASDCDFGHYVTLTLKQSGGSVTGDWSDGTRVRGSQGLIRGDIRNDQLIAKRCGDGSNVSGLPNCPAFEASHDTFVREGNALIWYQTYNSERTRYAELVRPPAKSDRTQGCEEDNASEGQG